MVTRGLIDAPVDLGQKRSGVAAAIIPKLIARVRRPVTRCNEKPDGKRAYQAVQ
jgi:hypothetical protein